jgi:DNA-binding LacI/PurR family transcriptional regulator
VGWDDIAESRFSVPSLSSISPDKEQLAEAAVSLLEARLSGSAQSSAQEIEVSFTLEVRESTIQSADVAAAPRRQRSPDKTLK